MVVNVPNIDLGMYKNYQDFHRLIFYGYTRLHMVGDIGLIEANQVFAFDVGITLSVTSLKLEIIVAKLDYKIDRK